MTPLKMLSAGVTVENDGDDLVKVVHRGAGIVRYGLRSTFFNNDGMISMVLHRDDGPAEIVQTDGSYYIRTQELWYRHGCVHRDDGPAVIVTHSGVVVEKIWYQNGRRHRVDGPAYIAKGPPMEGYYYYQGILIDSEDIKEIKANLGIRGVISKDMAPLFALALSGVVHGYG